MTAHKDGTLLLRWSCGKRTLPAVTGFEKPAVPRDQKKSGQARNRKKKQVGKRKL